MNTNVYGDSYGGLAQNELALDAGRDSRYFQSLSDQRARQQAAMNFALEQQRADDARAAQQASLQQSLLFHGDDLAQKQSAQDFAGTQADLNRQNNLDITDLNLDATRNRLDAGTQRKAFTDTYAAIQNGSIKTPLDLDGFAGDSLSSADKTRLTAFLKRAYDQQNTAYNAQSLMAQDATARYHAAIAPFEAGYNKIDSQLATAPDTAGWLDHLRGIQSKSDLQVDPMYKRYIQAQGDFDKMRDKQRNWAANLDYDPNAHTFAPRAQPLPPWDASAPIAQPSAPAVNNLGLPVAPATAAAAPAMPSLSSGPWVPNGAFEWDPSAYANLQAQLSALPPGDARQTKYSQVLRQAMATGQVRKAGSTGNTGAFELDPSAFATRW